MDELTSVFTEAVAGRISALETARRSLETDRAEALAAIRRIAHTLRGSGGTFGFPEVTLAAAAVEEAADDAIAAQLETLLAVLRYAQASGDAKASILVVDDDPALCAALQAGLAGPGREVLAAGTAAKADEILSRDKAALIILDLILPDRDGRTLLMKLRNDPRTAMTPVFVISAHFGALSKAECYSLGADECVEKPFDMAVMAAEVAEKLCRSARIAHDLHHDTLTGLLNRAGLQDIFAELASVAARSKQKLAVALIDLDNFKAVNDTHGHAAGDDVLRGVAAILTASLRKSDVVARWGGEEFVVLFPGADAAAAELALNKALKALRKHVFAAGERKFAMTFSGGVVEALQGHPLHRAVTDADLLMYEVKAGGRNAIRSAPALAAVRLKVLVAEDDSLIATVVKQRLQGEGLEVVHVPDGRAALEQAEQTQFAAVILDVNMPGMDGFEVLERLRQMPPYDRAPIIMLTAMGSEQDVVRGLKLGADDYVLKPFSPNELAARVTRLLRRG